MSETQGALHPEGNSSCLPKTNRLTDISPAKRDLFGINRELHFRVCTHGSRVQVPAQQGEKDAFIEGKRTLDRL